MTPTLIFDADGVFLSERPYWDAALAAALRDAGLSGGSGARLERLGDLAFGEIGLQRVTKRAGCNSNWDLAAVLARALARDELRELVALGLESGREREALQALERAASSLWKAAPGSGDPLSGFGVRRDGRDFARVVETFQRRIGKFPPAIPIEPLAGIARAFEEFERRGFRLRVCTGRPRSEIEPVLRQLGLERYLPPAALTCADEVERAERRCGGGPFGKPHWFGPVCALFGFDAAFDGLADRPFRPLTEPVVYAGDGWSDFLAVAACRERGLDLGYVHVRSAAVGPEQESAVAAAGFCLGVIDRLGQMGELLPERVA